MLRPGIYEQPISTGLERDLDAQESSGLVRADREALDSAEAAGILSEYVGRVLKRRLDVAAEEAGSSAAKSVASQIEIANQVLNVIAGEKNDGADQLSGSAEQLFSLVKSVDNEYEKDLEAKRLIRRPETSIAHTSLFTGSHNEPQLFEEMRQEIASADQIEMLVSFIKWSGLRLLEPDLKKFLARRPGGLKVIATTYMGATDPRAIEELLNMGAQVKISYDTKRTRLHAKAYIFRRDTGFTTAYVGSSNMSNVAMSSGLEWNIKLARKDQPAALDKIIGTFDSYWESDAFELYTRDDAARLKEAIQRERYSGESGGDEVLPCVFDVQPFPFQQRILDRLQAEREVGDRWHNLVVAATGTGKTVISAFDYKRFCARYLGGVHGKLLFVAHREEILKQSLATFRGVLKDPNFGELMVGNSKPNGVSHLFVSIQSFNAKALVERTSPEFYDYIIVDEFHHAAAPSYQKLLGYYRPSVLLGLTATPERMDGKTDQILDWFDGRIAAEIRLPEAIDRKLLCPFQYFGVADDADLSGLKWSRGRYDESALTNLYVFDQHAAKKRARLVIASVMRYVTDINEVKGLGFCVSKEHARFMAEQFNAAGIPSQHLTADSGETERVGVRGQLAAGALKFVFVVDLYNEGVDIPEVNTVLFLRPTESLTVFLQQLGRGLRLSPEKECLTVLDFIGQANKRYSFAQKFQSLLAPSSRSFKKNVTEGFVSTPKGCYIQLEKKAQEFILESIKNTAGARGWLVGLVESFREEYDEEPTLAAFLEKADIDPKELYGKGKSFSRLLQMAGEGPEVTDPDEADLSKALGRVASINSRRWIRFLIVVLSGDDGRGMSEFTDVEKRMLRMFQITVWPKSYDKKNPTPVLSDELECVARVRGNVLLVQEMIELLRFNLDHIDFVDEPVDLGFDCPLDLHCSYTRDQLFVAMDRMDPGNIRQGVSWVKDKGIDVLINTLNKSEKDYSPTTMYEDYSISDYLFHWQSQSTTSEGSSTGQRYIHHDEMGGRVCLFVREHKTDAFGTAPFTFLGLAHYQSHEGSSPMSIIWRLEKPIPAKYVVKTSKLAS